MDRPVLDHDGPWTEGAYLALAGDGLRAGDGRAELVDGALLVGPGSTPERTDVVERVRVAIASALPDGLRVLGPVALRLGRDCVLVPDLVVTRAVAAAATATPAAPTEEARPADSAPGDDRGPTGRRGRASRGAHAEDRDDVPEPIVASGKGRAADRTAKPTARSAGRAAAGATVTVPEPRVAAEASAPDVLDGDDALMVVEVVGREHGAVDRAFKPQVYARGHIPYSVLVDRDMPFAAADMIIGGRYHEYARASGDGVLVLEEPFALEIPLRAITEPRVSTPG